MAFAMRSFSQLFGTSLQRNCATILPVVSPLLQMCWAGVATSSTGQKVQFAEDRLLRYKPTSPGMRWLVRVDRSDLWKGKPVKSLTVGLRKTGGRNNQGRITVRHIGGGTKQRYRKVDFKRKILDIPGTVERLEYDPIRSARLALLKYPTGELAYIIAPKGISPGAEILASRTKELPIVTGNAMPLGLMPIGTVIHNVEMQPLRGAQIARAAGTSCQLLEKNYRPNYALIRTNAKEMRLLHHSCMATVGSVGNSMHHLEMAGKAGRTRLKGIRPTVRGVAMNPIDHPHGGNTSGGIPSCTPWGVPCKGKKTRSKRALRNPFILLRRNDSKALKAAA